MRPSRSQAGTAQTRLEKTVELTASRVLKKLIFGAVLRFRMANLDLLLIGPSRDPIIVSYQHCQIMWN